MTYQYLILQDGSLPLKPDGRRTSEDHACTSTLVWPSDTSPTPENSIVVDPCFSPASWDGTERRLEELDIGLSDIGYYCVTHQHYDHALNLPGRRSLEQTPAAASVLDWTLFTQDDLRLFPGMRLVDCPGHAPELQSLCCDTAEGETWIVGDAILDRDWLVRWMFYWPNGYDGTEIVETWRSVGKILETASVVIPGHGSPIVVDAELLQALLDGWPQAYRARECPDVSRCLMNRLERMA